MKGVTPQNRDWQCNPTGSDLVMQDTNVSHICSAHVPFFLDGRPFLKYRGELCWDGRFVYTTDIYTS